MFSTVAVGKKIAALRKSRNMTQMELADQMGVSYQAVSNWERGNSMPDISKLPELAAIFGVTIDELLGESSPLVASAAENRMEEYLSRNAVTQEELTAAAPILKPNQVDTASMSVTFDSMEALTAVAPFMSQSVLSQVVRPSVESDDFDGVEALAPFLEDDVLASIALRMAEQGRRPDDLVQFLDEAVVGACARKLVEQDVSITSLFPFMEESDAGKLAIELVGKGKPIEALLPFLRDEAADEAAWIVYQQQGVGRIAAFAPFLSDDMLHKIAQDAVQKHGFSSIAPIAPFL